MLETLQKEKEDYLLLQQQKALELEDTYREKNDLTKEDEQLKEKVFKLQKATITTISAKKKATKDFKELREEKQPMEEQM